MYVSSGKQLEPSLFGHVQYTDLGCFLVPADFWQFIASSCCTKGQAKVCLLMLWVNLENVLLVVLKVPFQEGLPGSLYSGSLLKFIIRHKLKSRCVAHGSVGSQVG